MEQHATVETEPAEQPGVETFVRFFKALADESRLRILGLLATQPRSVEELAALLDLSAPTVSHHLSRLKELGLVRMQPEGTTHLYALDATVLRRLSQALLAQGRVASFARDVEGDAWERKVLRDFFEGQRLKEIPASRKKRLVVMRWLAGQFEPGVRYPERAVNDLIKRYHPDAATLRRELIGHNLLRREGGRYWRTTEDEPPRLGRPA